MSEIKFEIIEHLFSLPAKGNWTKEMNLISWNDREPVYDLRGWDEEHTKMTRGITLTKEEFLALKDSFKEEVI